MSTSSSAEVAAPAALAHRGIRLIGCKASGRYLFESGVRLTNVEMHTPVFFGLHSYMNGGFIRSYVEIGRYCAIGRGVTLGSGVHNTMSLSVSAYLGGRSQRMTLKLAQENPKRRVIVGHDVWIGDNAFIMSGVTVGTGSVVAAGAVVTADVDPYSIVGGVPARQIGDRFDASLGRSLLSSAWWEVDPEVLVGLDVDDVEGCVAYIEQQSPRRIATEYLAADL